MIDLKNISKIYFKGTENEVAANDDISLRVDEGELIAIIGQSGSGKSTLMNIIGALDKPTEGEYILDNVAVHEIDDADLSDIRNQKIGFVFQTFNLLPKITAQQNVELPMLYAGASKSKRQKKARELLEVVGMLDRAKHYPNELSGGQKQRIAIARALVNDPSIILADEPTGALDSKTTKMVLELFQKLHKERNCTIVIITHSAEVAEVCERVVTIVDGKIIKDTANPAVSGGSSASGVSNNEESDIDDIMISSTKEGDE
jgi:putative ABC transport system ATP-binding protein